MILGIDPGCSGALVILDQEGNFIDATWNGNTFSNKKIRGFSLIKLYGR